MRIRDLIDLIEGMGDNDRTFFHVALAENLPSIMERGLIPTVGERSRQLREPSAIFLFPDEDHAADALGGWLGDQFDDDDEIEFALIEVTLPAEVEVHKNEDIDWEYWVKEPIGPECLRIVNAHY